MVSSDVASLFTNIPLDEFIDLAITCIYQGNPGLKISATDLKTFLFFATAETHSLFSEGVFYDQMDKVPMGPSFSSPCKPLYGPFMGHLEKKKKLIR